MTPPRQHQHFESASQITPIQNQPSNHQALIEDEPPRPASDLNQTLMNNETVFESFVEPSAQDLSQTVEQSVEMSYEASQDQINPSGHQADLPPKAKKKKKGKKKKHTED